MILGLDFDNTIVSYDRLFHRVALEKGLIPANLPVNKSEVRNYLRKAGQEELWTEMQGEVYGGRMSEAESYPGLRDFLFRCKEKGVSFRIVSHKTKYPFLGQKYDLHAAARKWLEEQGFFGVGQIGLKPEEAFFELTKEEKLHRIQASGCTHFIDDLPEILSHPEFPAQVERWLFDPGEMYPEENRFARATSWAGLNEALLP